MSHVIDKAEYLEIVNRNFQAAKDDVIARIRSLPRSVFIGLSLRRFEDSVEKYGGVGVGDRIDLEQKNLPQEMQDEIIDLLDYAGLNIHKKALK